MELDVVFVSVAPWALDVSTSTSRSLFTTGSMIGFDASGHIAEETRNAKYVESCLNPQYLSLTLISAQLPPGEC